MAKVARYLGGRVVIEDPDLALELERRGYGRRDDGLLVLESYEALYLVEKGRIEVLDGSSGRGISFQELLKLLEERDEKLWTRYLIYRDLRERGYVVREGFGLGIDFRLYGRGEFRRKPARYLVYGLLEGVPVRVAELEEVLRKALSTKKELILAVVDRRGEVVYYSLSRWAGPRGGEEIGL